jgi:hypothetical protein
VPFEGQSMGEILVKHVSQAPPAPRAINPQIPPAVEQIILRCLAKRPDDRFPTMKAMRDALLDADAYLASSPPVMPAALTTSSPAARTLFVDNGAPAANAAALGHAATSAMPAAQPPPVGRSTGPALALKAPPPSMIAHPGAEARTMFQPGNPQPVPPAGLGADARTAIVDGNADPALAAARRSTAVPGMQIPAQPTNQTMVIGTPAGYKDRPPRKTGLIVLLLVIAAAAVGGGIALAMMLGGGSSDSDPDPDPDPGPGSAAEAEAKSPPPPPPPPPPAAPDAGAATTVEPILVRVRIESEPPGAEVTIDGTARGVTPADVELAPDGAEHELVLRHPEMREKKKTIKVTGEQTIRLELEKAPRAEPEGDGDAKKPRDRKKPRDDKKKPGSDEDEDDLARPSWMKK